MRALIFALSILVIAAAAPSARAGLSTTPRETATSVDTASPAGETEANQQTEDQIGLTKAKRRDVQRRLGRLGFGTKVNGKFDDSTRDAIARWQEDHGYPKTGFLSPVQHDALLGESASTTETGKSDRRHGVSRARHSRSVGGPLGVIGSAVGGLFRR